MTPSPPRPRAPKQAKPFRVEFRRTLGDGPWSWCVVKRGDILAFSRSILQSEARRICRALNGDLYR